MDVTGGGRKIPANKKFIDHDNVEVVRLVAQISDRRLGGMIGRQRAGERDHKPLPIFPDRKYRNLDIAEAWAGDRDVCVEIDVSVTLSEKVAVK